MGDESVEAGRDDFVSVLQQAAHEDAIPVGVEHFEQPRFDLMGLSIFGTRDDRVGIPQTAPTLGERGERKPEAR